MLVFQVVRRKYQQEYDIAPPITFGGDHIALDIPDDGAQTDNGWEIKPLHKAHVSFTKFTQLPDLAMIFMFLILDQERSCQ